MLKLTVLTVLALSISLAPAHAFRSNDNGSSNTYTGGTSSSKQQQYQNQQQQYYNNQQQQQQATPSASLIRMSGSGNGTARQLAIEFDPQLRAAVNSRQALIRNVLIGRVDLNGDGKEEIFVYNENDQFCSNRTYCPFSIYQIGRNNSLVPLLQGYMTQNQIAVMDQYTSNWRDIIVYDGRGRQVALTFNGRQYVEPRRRGWR